MKIKQIATMSGAQDGAIYGNLLFRFNARGEGKVYDLSDIAEGGELTPIAALTLDRAEEIVPHSNAVFFGKEYYEEGDEFPLLYSNIYNNYKKSADPMLGVCLVYRLMRTASSFTTKLVQMIRIDFVEDASLWKASEEGHGERPYGNFVMDTETGALWAFTMRNEEKGTRFFRFDAPSVHEGEMGEDGIRRVLLFADDIKEYFDMPYYRFIQGAVMHGGKIYSTEGFQNDMVNRPAIRVVDPVARTEKYYDLTERGMMNEAEMIDFFEGCCYYSDADGYLYAVDFE